MPKRSNAFQRAAFVIHRSLEPEWKVTESDMLLDIHTGTSREVDITARRTAAGHELLLCVECRDHGRAADVSWVEQMFTKHQSLPTSKLALWSRSGFTREAIAKSKLLKIDAISQTVRAQPTWSKMADRLCAGFLQYVTPTFSPFVDVKLPTGQLQRYEDVASWVFLDQGGDVVGSIQALLQELQRNELVWITRRRETATSGLSLFRPLSGLWTFRRMDGAQSIALASACIPSGRNLLPPQ
jgi:hypothetical protein